MRCTVKSKLSTAGVNTWAPPTRIPENRSNPPEKGDAFVSDILHDDETFFARYRDGRATAAQLDDFVKAWHESGDAEQRSLSAFLAEPEEEWGVVFTPRPAWRPLPAARRSGRTL